MSLLLDALKRAAQEKLEKQRQDETGVAPADQELSLDLTDPGDDSNAVQAGSDSQLEPASRTDLRLHRADVLASELQAFMGRNTTEHEMPAREIPMQGEQPVPPRREPAVGTFTPAATPAAAARLFTNKRAGIIRSKEGMLIIGAGVAFLMIILFYIVSLNGLDHSNVRVDRLHAVVPLDSDTPADNNKIEAGLLVEQEAAGTLRDTTPATGESAPALFASNQAVESEAGRDSAPEPAPRSTVPRLSVQKSQQEALHHILLRAYNAYQNNDMDAAAVGYRQALARAPENRDALLGFAATAIQQGDYTAALECYNTLLNLDPNDDLALAGISGLKQQVQGAPTDESLIKRLLLKRPESAQLHFALGNGYSAAADWPKAQSAYFDAHRFDAQNPDYAYNLAVSLEHLQQDAAALRYYELALTLAAARKPNFDSALAAARVSILQAQTTATDAR